jgi:phage FluMu protein Com
MTGRTESPRELREIRCARCGRLLFKADAQGRVEAVCPARDCRRYQTFMLGDRRGR